MGTSGQTIDTTATTITGVNVGFLDSLDTTISCTSQTASYTGPTPTNNPSAFSSVTFTITDKGGAENTFTSTLDSINVLTKPNLLSAFSNKCGKTGPSVVLAQNKVLAPVVTGSSSLVYLVGDIPLVKSIDDFTTQMCSSSGGASTLTRTITSIPADVISKSAVTLSADPANSGKLLITVDSTDLTLVGVFELTVKASIPSGEFALLTMTLTMQTDCKAAGIKVYFGNVPHISQAKVDITTTPIVKQGFGASISDDGSVFYQPLLPYTLKPFDCGYILKYSLKLNNGDSVPSFIKFNSDLMRFEVTVNRQAGVEIVGTYQVRITATLDNPEKTYNDIVMWTLVIIGEKLIQSNPNHPPYFTTTLK